MKNNSYYQLIFLWLLSYFLVGSLGTEKLGLNLFAQEADLSKGLQPGDRVEVVLKNNQVFSGIIKAIKSDRITLDISYDDPVLKGIISFFWDDIKDIQQLRKLADDEKKQILSEKEQFLKKYKKEIQLTQIPSPEKAPPQEPEVKPEKPEKSKEEKEQERLLALLAEFPLSKWNQTKYNEIMQKIPIFRTAEEQKFLEIYNDWLKAVELNARLERQKLLEKFPPEKGWGEEKYRWLSRKFIVIGVALTAEEKEFVDRFKDWQKALEEKKEEEKKKEVEEKEQHKKEAPELPSFER